VKLAEVLGATFVPVDQARVAVPVSGTKIRQDPMKHWDYLPRCVRPYFARRVCVFGPESTGKSTLARDLAARFSTVWVPEYARTLLEAQGGRIEEGDIVRIARGQRASEDALARDANRILIQDTDLLETTIWSEALFGSCPPWIVEEAGRRAADLYLLTDVDVPWVKDAVRYLPDERRPFFDRCRAALESRKLRTVLVSGSWEQRRATATAAVESLLTSGPASPGAS
jgi:NadR type nicotinamide-nucleotide adenylyltransferase